MKSIAKPELLALLAILLLAAGLRFAYPGVNSFAGDEAHISIDALRMARGGEFVMAGQDSSVGIPFFPASVWLFAIPYAGNNFPAPLLIENPETELISHIYVARLEAGEALLQCYNRDQNELHDLAPLPLNLADDERAWWWMSPDETQIALAADGVSGGLWLIDLSTLPACN